MFCVPSFDEMTNLTPYFNDVIPGCRKHGMSDATFYNWKAKYAGLTVSELKRLKSLEDENRRLKQIVAQQALDNWALKELLSKNF